MKYLYLLFFAFAVNVTMVSCEETPDVSLEVDDSYTGKDDNGGDDDGENDGNTPAIDAEKLAEIVDAANDYLAEELYTITNKKDEAIPIMGTDEEGNFVKDKRYFTSIGSYWWPVYDKETGEVISYEYKDGVYNHDNDTKVYTDKKTFVAMTDAVKALGEAFYYTGNVAYAKKIQDIVQTFFVATDTKMLPTLEFGDMSFNDETRQFEYGSAFGILHTTSLKEMLIGVRYAQQWAGWNTQIDEEFNKWLTTFAEWLITHPLGIQEGNLFTYYYDDNGEIIRKKGLKNNHGTHFDSQYLSIMAHLGRQDLVKEYVDRIVVPRLYLHVVESSKKGVDDDYAVNGSEGGTQDFYYAGVGAQQTELARTKSWNYTIMNLDGWIRNAGYAETVGVDLWNQKSNKPGCEDVILIKSMIDWYIPYITGEKDWVWDQIIVGILDNVKPFLEIAIEKYPEDAEKYKKALEDMKPFTPTFPGALIVK